MIGLIIILEIVFLLVQFLILSKAESSFIKYLPLGIVISGLIFCISAYLNVFWSNYPDVIFEN